MFIVNHPKIRCGWSASSNFGQDGSRSLVMLAVILSRKITRSRFLGQEDMELSHPAVIEVFVVRVPKLASFSIQASTKPS